MAVKPTGSTQDSKFASDQSSTDSQSGNGNDGLENNRSSEQPGIQVTNVLDEVLAADLAKKTAEQEPKKENDMQAFNLSILAPERRLLEGERAASLIVTTTEGEIEILPGHANLVAVLGTGRFVYTLRGEKPVTGVISSGFLNVEDGSVKVVAETIEVAKEINLERARTAQSKAEAELSKGTLDEATSRKYQMKLQRAQVRQSIGSAVH